MDQAPERRQPAEEPGEVREVPDRLDVVHPRIDEQDVDRAVTDDLIGEVHVPDTREPCLDFLPHRPERIRRRPGRGRRCRLLTLGSSVKVHDAVIGSLIRPHPQ
jgi:hypothetical protein